MNDMQNASHGRISLIDLLEMFPDEESATRWFEEQLWPEGRVCNHCGGTRTTKAPNADPLPYWCPDCREYFSVRTGTPMHRSKIPLRKWVIALFLEAMSPKGIASTRLAEAIGISQKSAWFMLHRIRQGFAGAVDGGALSGPVEVDETHVGGRRKNLSNKQRRALWRAGIKGPVDQSIVVGMVDRVTGQVRAERIEAADRETLHGFICENTSPRATVYTDEATPYKSMPRDHECVNHSMFEFARSEVSTNSIESFWSIIKRSHKGVFHKFSEKHLDRYLTQFAGKRSLRELSAETQMERVASGFSGRRLTYAELVEGNGLNSGARPCRIP